MFDRIHKIVLSALGIASHTEAEQKKVLEKIGPMLYQAIMTRTLLEMEEEDKNTFTEMMSKNPSPEIMFTFLTEACPEIDDIAKEEALRVRKEHKNILAVA